MPKPKEVLRFLKRRGFVEKRQRGSHLVLEHPQTGFRTVLPMHPGDLPKGLFHRILADAGYSVEDFHND